MSPLPSAWELEGTQAVEPLTRPHRAAALIGAELRQIIANTRHLRRCHWSDVSTAASSHECPILAGINSRIKLTF